MHDIACHTGSLDRDLHKLALRKYADRDSSRPSRLTGESVLSAAPSPIEIRCLHCQYRITDLNASITVQDQHQHHCINPHSFEFRISCFNNAPGCSISGIPTAEHSWFAGYQWQYAQCKQCRQHLGWYFHNGQNDFFGLICTRLLFPKSL